MKRSNKSSEVPYGVVLQDVIATLSFVPMSGMCRLVLMGCVCFAVCVKLVQAILPLWSKVLWMLQQHFFEFLGLSLWLHAQFGLVCAKGIQPSGVCWLIGYMVCLGVGDLWFPFLCCCMVLVVCRLICLPLLFGWIFWLKLHCHI